MPATVILECPKCTGLLLAAKTQKTRACPYCGARVELQKAKRLASAKTAFEASEMLRKIKAQRQSNTRKNNSE
jgi:DNA-directed RNA polymerase subunit M/transcription elongation factor TFIIS